MRYGKLVGHVGHFGMHLIHSTSQTTLLTNLRPCDTFLCRLRGLMFRAALQPGEGLLFIHPRESVVDATIHMLFMRFPIAVIWLNAQQQVVDTTLAKPWRPIYAPRQPARYLIETSPALLSQVQPGDTLTWHMPPN